MVKQNIGIKAKKPEKECKDEKCPWHGTLPVRGRVFTGIVTSSKPPKTAIVKWDYHYFLKKYERYEKRNTRIVAYNPECISAKKGDLVKIAECRPLSKTKSFTVVEVLQK